MKTQLSAYRLVGIQHTLVACVGFILVVSTAHSQLSKRQQAFAALDRGEIRLAQSLYLDLMKTRSADPTICFETGIAFFSGTPDEQVEAVRYFEMARDRSNANDTIPELYYYLGRSLQYSHRCKEAKTAYQHFNRQIEHMHHSHKLRKEMKERIEMCDHCIFYKKLNEVNPLTRHEQIKDRQRYFISHTEYYLFENFGRDVNTEDADYANVLYDGDRKMLFTSRRLENELDAKYVDGKYYENIYLAKWENEDIYKPTEVEKTDFFTSKSKDQFHKATVSIGPKEDKIFIYKNQKIWMSNRNGESWDEPKALPDVINELNARVTSVFLSEDESTLLVTSDRKGGYGKLDIYQSEKNDDGSWGSLENLGRQVNSKFNEETPWMTKDGKRLYFSSKGHSSIGGYDVFYSERKEDGSWKRPMNLGIPINTPNDELHYIGSRYDSLVAFYSSRRTGGYGDFDLYKISRHKVEELDQLATTTVSFRDSFLVSKEQTSRQMIAQVPRIPVPTFLPEDTALIADIPDNPEQVKDDFAEPVKQPEPTQEPEQAVVVQEPVEVETKETAAPTSTPSPAPVEGDLLADILFGFDGSSLSSASKEQLKKLKAQLDQNPNTIVNLAGHTDSLGTDEVNMVVSKQRALHVYDYLVSIGFDPMRIGLSYHGESQPKVPNDSKANRAQNRRVDLSLDEYTYYNYINFGFNSSDVGDQVKAASIASAIKGLSGEIELSGFTDPKGNADYNKKLSERRVNSVADYMKGQGLQESRMKLYSFGEEKPRLPSSYPNADAMNRRVEIKIRK